MRYSISEMAKCSGVSVRTLHYYDRIGLLHPSEVTAGNGYRWYGQAELLRLQQILLYRELDFSLTEIGEILSAPNYDVRQALQRQRELLALQQKRLSRLMGLLDKQLKGAQNMEFSEFSTAELDAAKAAYRAEAREKWGHTTAWRQSEEKAQKRTKPEESALQSQMNDLLRQFAAARHTDPAGAEAQQLVKAWQAFLTAHYYDCTEEILAGLGQMYTADDRFRANLDQLGAGTAAFLSAAIAAFCQR